MDRGNRRIACDPDRDLDLAQAGSLLGEVGNPKPSFTIKDKRAKPKPKPSKPTLVSPTVSLCMIAKDESRVLNDCLTSIKPWVDEIILVDTGSTDTTVDIAKSHGAKVFHFPWIDDFSAARNESIAHATGDFIFWMDCDDVIGEESGRSLREMALVAEAKTGGILMQVHIPPAKGESGFTIVDHVKLFRNRPEFRFLGRIHEQILEPIYAAGYSIERSNSFVTHSGYDYSPQGQQAKRERDLRILALDLVDRPNHPFVLFNIGMTDFHMKQFPKAKETLELCLSLITPKESITRKVYAMLVGCELEMGDPRAARGRLEQGLKLFPRDPELLFRAGIVYHECRDPNRAIQSYLKLLNDHETGHIDSLDVSMTNWKAHNNLAVIYRDLGRYEEADMHWKRHRGQTGRSRRTDRRSVHH